MKVHTPKAVIILLFAIVLFAKSVPSWAQCNHAHPAYSSDIPFHPASVTLNGNARFVRRANGQPVLQLNTKVWQVGSAWFNTQQEVASGFSTTFAFALIRPIYDNADGIAFVIQNNALTALGPVGGGLGFGQWPGGTGGIPNSLAVELNTWDNPGWDQSDNSISIQSCGTAPNSVDTFSTCDLGINPNLPVTLADGKVHTVTVTYDGANIDVILDGNDLFPGGVAVDLGTLLNLNDGAAYVGFTGADGGGGNTQVILSWTFSPQSMPTEPTTEMCGQKIWE